MVLTKHNYRELFPTLSQTNKGPIPVGQDMWPGLLGTRPTTSYKP